MIDSEDVLEEKHKGGSKVDALSFFKNLWKETLHASWELFKITIPVIILTKILGEFGLIEYMSGLLEPVMAIVGLPGELGLVWATGMLTSLYGAVAVFATIGPALDLTVAQVTVLGAILLIAHSLPVELSVSKKSGAPFTPIALIRILGAVLYGYLLITFCNYFSIWQDDARMLFQATSQDAGLLEWSIDQIKNLGLIVIVIFIILVLMEIFKAIGLLALFEKMLNPVLPVFGMSKEVAPITVIGMIMGIGYGGALIIRETSLGRISKKEIFYSMALMGLCHGLIEDTLLMVAIGGKLGGLLWGRIVFALIITFLLVCIMNKLEKRRMSITKSV